MALAQLCECAITRTFGSGVKASVPADADLDLKRPVLLSWRNSGGVQVSIALKGISNPRAIFWFDSAELIEDADGLSVFNDKQSVSSAKYTYSFRCQRSMIFAEVRPNADLMNEVSKNPSDSTTAPSLRPRWAEENRPKKQVKLRLPPDLIDKVDAAVEGTELNRNDWIERAIQKALKPK
ncbi:hypothetical protein GCM10007908_04040 [Rhizobium albus]|nr:hypothetical protein GCM10007908_04040 [Rhizobium albus]